MLIRYEWRELTPEGLLIKPKDVGPHYSSENINGYDGFTNKEEAVEAYKSFRQKYNWDTPRELVLVESYQM